MTDRALLVNVAKAARKLLDSGLYHSETKIMHDLDRVQELTRALMECGLDIYQEVEDGRTNSRLETIEVAGVCGVLRMVPPRSPRGR